MWALPTRSFDGISRTEFDRLRSRRPYLVDNGSPFSANWLRWKIEASASPEVLAKDNSHDVRGDRPPYKRRGRRKSRRPVERCKGFTRLS
jgi:hypothetical protein